MLERGRIQDIVWQSPSWARGDNDFVESENIHES